MIKYEPVTHHELKFEEGKPLPLYYLYTLVGQEYEFYRNEPEILRSRGEDVEYILDTLHTVLNGLPEVDNNYHDNNMHVFNIHFGGGNKSKLARVCFYIEGDVLRCKIQRGRYGEGYSNIFTYIEYEPGFYMSWDVEALVFYGFIDDSEDYND